MAVKQIVYVGEPLLRKTSIDVPLEDITKLYIQEVIQDLTDTLLHYTTRKGKMKGVGIAANQIGINYRIFVMCVEDDPKMPLTVCINPVMLSKSTPMLESFEGCMSFKHFRVRVERFKTIEAQAYNKEGKQFNLHLEDFYARIFQHEYDHLDGIIYSDKADMSTLVTEKTYKKKWKRANIDLIKALRSHQY